MKKKEWIHYVATHNTIEAKIPNMESSDILEKLSAIPKRKLSETQTKHSPNVEHSVIFLALKR